MALAAAVLIASLASGLERPACAEAHGPVAPVASGYLARVTSAPAGVEAKVVDGDQRMWLRALAGNTVVVLDYRAVPYLRFTSTGIQVNRNSAMYYLNLVPSEQPPLRLSPAPSWQTVSGGREYLWHDGRVHALATVALPPGSMGITFIGLWRIPILVDGRPGTISGGLWHAPAPSPVWFWPIIVLLLCVAAVWRIGRPSLDVFFARILGLVAMAALVVAAAGRELYGRPFVSSSQVVVLALIVSFAVLAVARLVLRRPGFFSLLVIGAASIWAGVDLLPTLVNGFVLMVVSPFVARTATVLCLGPGSASRCWGSAPARRTGRKRATRRTRRLRWAHRRPRANALPPCDRVRGLCRLAGADRARADSSPPARAGAADRARCEVPAARHRRSGRTLCTDARAPAGCPRRGVRREPRRPDPGRHRDAAAARIRGWQDCRSGLLGELATIDPTGLVLVRAGAMLTLADLFRAWGEPLSEHRIASFAPRPPSHVRVYVDGRPWRAPPGAVPLRRHSEVVLEAGPYVPPLQRLRVSARQLRRGRRHASILRWACRSAREIGRSSSFHWP